MGQAAVAVRPTALATTARRIEERIVEGRYRPGDAVRLTEVVDELVVSRSTAREALRLVASTGLLDLSHGRIARVTALTYSEAESFYRMRSVFEPLLISRFAQRASHQERAALERAAEAMMESAHSADVLPRTYRRREGFYSVLLHGAKSPSLARVARSEDLRLAAYRFNVLPRAVEFQRLRSSHRRLREVLHWLGRGDGDRAARTCERAALDDASTTLREIRSAL